MGPKIVAISDLHLDWVTAGVSRFEESARALHQAVEYAVDHAADLFVFGGDAVDPDSGPVVLRASKELVWAATTLHNEKVQSVWIKGNHDVSWGDSSSGLDAVEGLNLAYVNVVSGCPKLIGSNVLHDFMVLGLPYPSTPKGWVRSLEQVIQENKSSIRFPLIVAAHLSIEGVIPGEESAEMSSKKDVFFPVKEVKAHNPNLMLAGHYHKRQTTADGIQIIGSPLRLTFGHEGHESPGFMVIDFEN